jgi:hypothetical protein
MFGRKEAPLSVSVPRPEDDRAITSKVGIVAVAGFAVGVLWPRLVGYKPGPNPPESGTHVVAPAAEPAASASDDPSAAPSIVLPEPPKVSNKEIVVIADGEITSCVNKKGDRIADCGRLSLDRLVEPKLKAIGDCAFAIGLEGDVTFALNLNFEKSTVDVLEGKKKAPWPTMTTRGLLKCAVDELKDLELDKIPHTHPRYVVEYGLTFYPPGKGPDDDKGAGGAEPASSEDADASLGRATVVFEKGLLRAAPKDGKIVARLPQGTRVKLEKQDKDWYYVSSGSSKGWIHRQAIGK